MSAAAVDALNRTNAENRELIQEYHSSKYDAKTNRCYIEIFQHKKIGKHKSIEVQASSKSTMAKLMNCSRLLDSKTAQ